MHGLLFVERGVLTRTANIVDDIPDVEHLLILEILGWQSDIVYDIKYNVCYIAKINGGVGTVIEIFDWLCNIINNLY